MTLAHPAHRSRGIVRSLAVGWLVVALALAVFSPMSAWATTPPTSGSGTQAPSTSAPDNSTASSTGSSQRIPVPTWMFVAGGVLIFVAAGWMVQANRRRA